MTAKPSDERIPTRPSLLARGMRLFSTGLFLLLCLAAGLGISFWMSLPDLSTLEDPHGSLTITVRDWQGEEHPFILGPQNPDWTPLDNFPEHLPWAVIVAEDASFYQHRGIDLDATREALLYDLEQKKMARGASTITQQLAKNLFLSREKKLSRKLREAAIAWQLENHLSKERILELYLNLVELGPLVHGMTAGARYHFGKPVSELSAAESAFLAAILPGPRVAFNPQKHPERVRKRAASLLNFMSLRKILTEDEYQDQLSALERFRSEDGIFTEGKEIKNFETACSETGEPLSNGQPPAWQLPRS